MRIDTTRARQALGIQCPVKIVNWPSPPGELGGVNPEDPTTVRLDLAQINEYGDDLKRIVGHELVHVRQMLDIGDPVTAHMMYLREHADYGYEGNRFEREARELERHVAPLIEVTA